MTGDVDLGSDFDPFAEDESDGDEWFTERGAAIRTESHDSDDDDDEMDVQL